MDRDLLDKFNKVEKFHWWWEGRRELIKLLLVDQKPKRVLDIGSGTGETLSFLKKIYPKARFTGVDILPEAVSYTKKNGHKAFVSSATRLPFKKNSFDLILILDVIEHIKNDLAVVREAKRVLSPGGVIIITAPALPFMWSAHDKNQGHFRRYTSNQMEKLARKSKLSLEFLSYFNFLLSPPIIIIRLLSRLPVLSYFSTYDSKLNYNIAYKSKANSLLTRIFTTEIKLTKYIRYPFGVSVALVLKKS